MLDPPLRFPSPHYGIAVLEYHRGISPIHIYGEFIGGLRVISRTPNFLIVPLLTKPDCGNRD